VGTYGEALYGIKGGFLIIGLTGYTGSGCSTASRILRKKSKPTLPDIKTLGIQPEKRLYSKLERVWRDLTWDQLEQFVDIEVSRVIFMFAVYRALRYDYKRGPLVILRKLVLSGKNEGYIESVGCLTKDKIDMKQGGVAERLVDAYQKAKPLYRQFKQKCYKDLATFIEAMQDYGDDIRKFGCVQPITRRKPEPKNITVLPEALRRLTKAYIIRKNASRFIIDAFRNPYEVEYFKRRYSEFYLVVIQRPADERRAVLKGPKSQMSSEAIEKLEEREKGYKEKRRKNNIGNWVTSQNLDECFQKADYIIENTSQDSRSWSQLTYNLIRFMCLVKKPGCIPPSKDERNMQIAMSIKHNSGCLSRHVGAVVVDSKGYLLGIGWNNPPVGQVPCALRTGNELVDSPCPDRVAFSSSERGDVFTEHIGNRYTDKPYCFKDEYGCISKKAELCRALHAEENAIRQVNGKNLKGMTLYTTDSPCENCAKVIYQSNIGRIVYIEEYPGIARQQMQSGNKEIKWEQFKGVTGSGYCRLFNSFMPEKDMLDLYS